MTATNGTVTPGTAPGAPDPATIRVRGSLDFHNFSSLVEEARRQYDAGSRHLRVDLGGVSQVDIAGLTALYAVAELFDGRPVPDFSQAWVDIQPTLETGEGHHTRAVELVGVTDDVATELERAGLLGRFVLPAREP